MNSADREFADAISKAADSQAGKIGVYAFLRQVGDTISTADAPMHEKQAAKGILSGQLGTIKTPMISPEQLNVAVGKLRTQAKLLAVKEDRLTEGEKRNLAALRLAISACEFRIDAGLPDDKGVPTQPVKAPAPKAAPKQQPLRNGNMRTHSITNAMYARCAEGGLNFNAARPLVETFVKALHVDEMSEMTLARFRNHIERQERLSRGGTDLTHTALAALLKQAAHDVRETENIGRNTEGLVEGACKQAVLAFVAGRAEPETDDVNASKAAPAPAIEPAKPEAAKAAAESKPLGHMAMIRQAAANLAAKNGEAPATHPDIISPPAPKPAVAAKPAPAPAALKPEPARTPASIPAATIETPPATTMVEKVKSAPRRTSAPVREQGPLPRTFEGACAAMREWLEKHDYEIEALKDPERLKALSREDLERSSQPVQRAILHAHTGKAEGQRLYSNLLMLHRITTNPDMDYLGVLWGDGGVMRR